MHLFDLSGNTALSADGGACAGDWPLHPTTAGASWRMTRMGTATAVRSIHAGEPSAISVPKTENALRPPPPRGFNFATDGAALFFAGAQEVQSAVPDSSSYSCHTKHACS